MGLLCLHCMLCLLGLLYSNNLAGLPFCSYRASGAMTPHYTLSVDLLSGKNRITIELYDGQETSIPFFG